MNPNTAEAWNIKWRHIKRIQANDSWIKQRIIKVASLIPADSTVLDVASGPGLIFSYLDTSVDYTAFDFSIEALKLSPGKYILGDLLTYKLIPSSYSTVLCMEILEHLDKPELTIKKFSTVCSCQVIFTVPNNRLPPSQAPFHVDIFTSEKLLNLINSSYNFYRVHTYYTGGNIICQCLK